MLADAAQHTPSLGHLLPWLLAWFLALPFVGAAVLLRERAKARRARRCSCPRSRPPGR